MSSATAAAAAAAGDGSDDTFDASSGGDNLLVECLVCMGEHLRSHIAVCHTASCDFAVCFSCACKLQGTHVCDNYGCTRIHWRCPHCGGPGGGRVDETLVSEEGEPLGTGRSLDVRDPQIKADCGALASLMDSSRLQTQQSSDMAEQFHRTALCLLMTRDVLRSIIASTAPSSSAPEHPARAQIRALISSSEASFSSLDGPVYDCLQRDYLHTRTVVHLRRLRCWDDHLSGTRGREEDGTLECHLCGWGALADGTSLEQAWPQNSTVLLSNTDPPSPELDMSGKVAVVTDWQDSRSLQRLSRQVQRAGGLAIFVANGEEEEPREFFVQECAVPAVSITDLDARRMLDHSRCTCGGEKMLLSIAVQPRGTVIV